MRWFFFGTLTDRDVLALVLGREPVAASLRPARLRGFRRVVVKDESYPALRADPDGAVDGLLVSGLSAEDLRRILFFEGDEFELRPLAVRDDDGAEVEALTFLATDAAELDDSEWRLADWQRHHKHGFLPMARDWMAAIDHDDPHASEARWQAALTALRSRS